MLYSGIYTKSFETFLQPFSEFFGKFIILVGNFEKYLYVYSWLVF